MTCTGLGLHRIKKLRAELPRGPSEPESKGDLRAAIADMAGRMSDLEGQKGRGSGCAVI